MSEEADRANSKPPSLDRLSVLWRRINDYKIAQWSVAYVALAYGIQHGVVLTSDAFDWPHVVARISMLLLVLGLPVVMTLAWYHGERASRRISGPELTIISILLVMSSLLFYVFVRPSEVNGTAPQQASVAAARAASLSRGNAISIAVLPFVNLSSDTEQEFFSDGMTEEITTALAKIPDLRVVARESAFQFKGEKKDLRTVGQTLGATHLIEGSVRKAGTRVRITAQLIKADDGTNIWAESYDRDLKDVFAVQEDIAQAIAASLQVPLGLKEGEQLVSSRGIDPDSYQVYLKAKALVRGRGLDALTNGAALLERVVTQNPGYSPAWAVLAIAYQVRPNFHPAWLSGSSVTEMRRIVDADIPKAEAAARRAIQLDSRNSDAYVALATVLRSRGKLVEAETLYQKALQLDGDNAEAIHQYSELVSEVGRSKEAAQMRQRLRILEPFVPVYNFNSAVILNANGNREEALALVNELPANNVYRQYKLAEIYAAKGRFGEAADLVARLSAESFYPAVTQEATRLLRIAPNPAPSVQTLPRLGLLSFVYLYTGAPERSLELAEQDAEIGYSVAGLVDTLWDSEYADVRKTERFRTYARKAGLVDYWKVKGWPPQCHPTAGEDFECS